MNQSETLADPKQTQSCVNGATGLIPVNSDSKSRVADCILCSDQQGATPLVVSIEVYRK